MADWPITPTYNGEYLDNALDKPVNAIAALFSVVNDVATIIAARGAPDGIASLVGGKVPVEQLPGGGTYQGYSDLLTSIATAAAAPDKIFYLTGAASVALANLSAYVRDRLGAADGAAFRTAHGLEIGTDVQAHSAALAAIAALAAGAGLLRRNADGSWLVDETAYITDATLATYALRDWVNSLIATVYADMDPLVTLEDIDDLYLHWLDSGAAGRAVLAGATADAILNTLGIPTPRTDNTGSDATNYERLALDWAANIARLIVSQGGTGTLRDLQIAIGNTFWQLKADGTLWVEVAGQTAGNARGSGAIDLCNVRTGATNVASGANAFQAGKDNRASGAQSVALGDSCIASGTGAVAIGYSCNATQSRTTALGALASANLYGECARGFGGSIGGEAQIRELGLRGNTTNDTATELFLNGIASNRAVVPAKGVWRVKGACIAEKSDYTAASAWDVECVIARDNSNVTRLIGSASATLVQQDAALSGCAVALTADDTNEALKVTVTGLAATNLKWFVALYCTQVIQA